MNKELEKAVITVVGKDTKGIISAVSTDLSNHNVNILDISQTIIDGYFSMIMVTDISDCDCSLTDLSESLNLVGKNVGTIITCQHEDLFKFMHRV